MAKSVTSVISVNGAPVMMNMCRTRKKLFHFADLQVGEGEILVWYYLIETSATQPCLLYLKYGPHSSCQMIWLMVTMVTMGVTFSQVVWLIGC